LLLLLLLLDLQEFFRSDYFIEVGAAGLMHKIRQAVEATLAGGGRALGFRVPGFRVPAFRVQGFRVPGLRLGMLALSDVVCLVNCYPVHRCFGNGKQTLCL
jgi:hypothetical protein